MLGSAAGGGFPQWNCGCFNCQGVRSGTIRAVPRRQESVAISADGEAWTLLNASPEIRAQIESFAPLWPRAPRHSPISGIVLGNGDLDHVLGLLSLRESQPISVYATAAVWLGFTQGNLLFRTLQRFPGQVTWHPLSLGVERALGGGEGKSRGKGGGEVGGDDDRNRDRDGDGDGSGDGDARLRVSPFAVPGKRPIHLEAPGGVEAGHAASPEDNVGLSIRDRLGGGVLAYVPAAARWTPALDEALAGADVVFFDGTFWSSDELARAGAGGKRAEDMAHLPVGGSDGSLARLSRLPARRKILIHVNNTNPLLREDSAERASVDAAGVEVAYDGMEVDA